MRTGMWLVGARGSVAVTTVTGLLALRAGLAPTTGCVTELPPLRGPHLPGFDELFVGGHDIMDTPLSKRAETLVAAGVLPAVLVGAVAAELDAVEADLRPLPQAATQASAIAMIVRDLAEFRDRHRLDHIVVINVASTEPRPGPELAQMDLATLTAALAGPAVLPPSSVMAYAAFEAGCGFVDFTPSAGARLPALDDLARQRGVPYTGHDGKTGETLVKSVLAPMFAMRNLQIGSWSGINLLGGGDGAVLAEPGPKAAKVASKDRVLESVLGYRPEATTQINYVADLGDFKTAWDLISFSGFLGTRMRMEFTWHGCDSALAAPLILDLARIVSAAQEAGRHGPLPELAFFFKDPVGDAPPGLAEQWTSLIHFVAGLAPTGAPDQQSESA
ncbi:inositol-3-phosphate synthase [Pilimelia columellifera]|uniref:Inositol-3-phosphate synthase n=1 Tax=Pilimelia columellifera subsp. columellifera TaxID=706583 RepID=A0ABN3NRR8_9ACTN